MFAFTKLIIICGFLNVVTCDFFHEPSVNVFTANGGDNNNFGFSMGFQNRTNATLVVSAPTETYIGKVYACPLTDFEKVDCKPVDIDVDKLAQSNRTLVNENQNFHLGASIAATPDYFVTCAPLWIGLKKKFTNDVRPVLSYGACFMYNGVAETIKLLDKHYHGWNTLADEKKILIANPRPTSGNFYYMDTASPLKPMSYKTDRIEFLNTGLASGNFLNKGKMYAFSVQDRTMTGRIYFLEEVGPRAMLVLNKKTSMITNSVKGSMFGYTMSAADMNKDGVSDLIVGAPLFREDYDRPELGAIHIYVGSVHINTRNNMRTIVGSIEGGMFGMAIATGDIDGDEIPEIIVSAPYENAGEGAVYILSGHELNKELFQTENFMQIQLSRLKMTQKIQKEGFKRFGFSLQIVKDVDENGFNDLAIGSPGKGSVMLYRSLHVIKPSISLKLLSGSSPDSLQIIGDPDSFNVEVCIHLEYKVKTKVVPGSIYGNYIVNRGEGDVKVEPPYFVIDLSEGVPKKCYNVVATFSENPTGTYVFETVINIIDESEKLKQKDFSNSTAVFAPDSETHKSITITVFCKDKEECLPKLSLMPPEWTGGREYAVGTSETETINIKVRNDGHSVSTACVLVELQGAGISKSPGFEVMETGKYRYKLITIRKNVEKSINLTLDMTNITNYDRDLKIKFSLYEVCESRKFIAEQNLTATYSFDTKAITVISANYNLVITGTEMAKEETESFSVNQEYLIGNSGNIKWVNLSALIEIEKSPFNLLANVAITEKDVCTQMPKTEKIIFNCTLSLEKKSSTKLIVRVQIPKEDWAKFIQVGNKDTKIQSKLLLNLGEDNNTVTSSSESLVTYNNDFSLGNNMTLIIIIVTVIALLLLGGICYFLYRKGFFQTKNKKKLLAAKETVRRKSLKKSTTSQNTQPPSDEGNDDIEVEVQDNVFEDTPAGSSSKDKHELIQDKAQVHC